MKTTTLSLSLLLFGVAAGPSRAGQIQFAPGLDVENGVATEQRTPVPLASGPNAFTDFESRVKAVIERRDLAGAGELYQTNTVTAADMKRELARWQPLFAPGAGSNVAMYFKELGTLPSPAARRVWGDYARRLTTHRVTHLVALSNGTAARLVFPLVEVDGRLWIVPSDKVRPGPGLKRAPQ